MALGRSVNVGHYPLAPLPHAPGYCWEALRAQWVEGDPYQPEAATATYYQVKAQIAAWLQPTRVVEIGVRAGYSALAMHMGHPFTEFYGLDMDAGGWGGVQGYLLEASKRLSTLPGLHAILESGDSQQIKTMHAQAKRADLFHVDGDHSPKGCAHDILLALHNGARYVVVDDYDFSATVTEGADWAIAHYGLTAWYAGDGGYRGNVVIQGRELRAST